MQSLTSLNSATKETIKVIEPVIHLERNLRASVRLTGESLESLKQQRRTLAQNQVAKSISMHDFRGGNSTSIKRSATFHHSNLNDSFSASHIDSIRRPIDDAIYHEEQEQLFINQDVTLQWKCEQELSSFQRYSFKHLINSEACETAKMFKLMICNDAMKNLNRSALFATITVVEHGPANSRIYKEIFNKKVWISAKQSVTYMLTISAASSVFVQLQSFALFTRTPISIRLLQSHCENAQKKIRFIIDEANVIDETANDHSTVENSVDEGKSILKRTKETVHPKSASLPTELPSTPSIHNYSPVNNMYHTTRTTQVNNGEQIHKRELSIDTENVKQGGVSASRDRSSSSIAVPQIDQHSSSVVELTDTDEGTHFEDEEEFFDPTSVTTPTNADRRVVSVTTTANRDQKPPLSPFTIIDDHFSNTQFCQPDLDEEETERERLL